MFLLTELLLEEDHGSSFIGQLNQQIKPEKSSIKSEEWSQNKQWNQQNHHRLPPAKTPRSFIRQGAVAACLLWLWPSSLKNVFFLFRDTRFQKKRCRKWEKKKMDPKILEGSMPPTVLITNPVLATFAPVYGRMSTKWWGNSGQIEWRQNRFFFFYCHGWHAKDTMWVCPTEKKKKAMYRLKWAYKRSMIQSSVNCACVLYAVCVCMCVCVCVCVCVWERERERERERDEMEGSLTSAPCP